MTTFHIYHESTAQYLGHVEASDADAARVLANYVWPSSPLKVESRRLRTGLRLAA